MDYGRPSVITFKIKLGDIHEIYRNRLIAEIVKYNITKDIFGFGYEFEFTGMTVGDVPAAKYFKHRGNKRLYTDARKIS